MNLNLDGSTSINSLYLEYTGVATSVTLNGLVLDNLETIQTVGNHEIVFYGVNDYIKSFTFVIDPLISGLTDGDDITGLVTFDVSDYQDIKLDNRSITETEITQIGNHVFDY